MNAVLFMLSLTIIQTLRLVQDTAMKLLFQLGNGRAAVVPVQPRLFVRASSELEHGDKPGGGGGGQQQSEALLPGGRRIDLRPFRHVTRSGW